MVVLVAEAEKTIVPARPLREVAVIVTGGIVPPEATLTAEAELATEKLGHGPVVTVMISGEVTTEPSDAIAAPVDEPASPERNAGPLEPW